MAKQIAVISVNRGTEAEFINQVRPLGPGEFGYATDTDELKIGDGTTSWADLPTRMGAIKISQSDFDAMPIKNSSTLYLIKGGV